MADISREDLAYAAGIIDGEGSINRTGRIGSIATRPAVQRQFKRCREQLSVLHARRAA